MLLSDAQFGASLTAVVIYDCYMFIIQATTSHFANPQKAVFKMELVA
jgi:hypothetical protein